MSVAAAGTTRTGSFALEGPASWLDNSDLEGGDKPGRAAERGVTERRSQRGQP